MKLTLTAEWREIPAGDEIDADWLLEIAGCRATVMWRADCISWDVTFPGGGGEGGSFHAPAGDEHGDGALTPMESARLYRLAKADAETSIREGFALREALR